MGFDANNFMLLFNVIIGVFAVYSAITGSGPAYKNDYPASIKAEADAMLRKFLWIIGPILLAGSALEYFYDSIPIFGPEGDFYVALGTIAVCLVLVVVYVVQFRRKYGKALDGKK